MDKTSVIILCIFPQYYAKIRGFHGIGKSKRKIKDWTQWEKEVQIPETDGKLFKNEKQKASQKTKKCPPDSKSRTLLFRGHFCILFYSSDSDPDSVKRAVSGA